MTKALLPVEVGAACNGCVLLLAKDVAPYGELRASFRRTRVDDYALSKSGREMYGTRFVNTRR